MRSVCGSGRLPFKQRPSGAHAAQEGDVAGHAVRGEVFRCADRGAELLQHAGGGGDELLGIDVQSFQDLRGFARNVALLVTLALESTRPRPRQQPRFQVSYRPGSVSRFR